jgi:hypothetical protein
MAAAIKSLIINPEKLRRMGVAARKYAEGRSFQCAFEQSWRMYMDPSEEKTAPEQTLSVAV